MAVIVTKNWSGVRRSHKSFDQTFDAVFVVTGTGDSEAAISAALAHDTPYGSNSNMRAGERHAEQFGPQAFKVYAHFSFGDHGLDANSPLDENPLIFWEPTRETISVDTDIDGNPITNSAGDPFNPGPTRPIPVPTLVIRRYESAYNVGFANGFIDHVNSNDFTVAGAGPILAGQGYCVDFKPCAPYTLAAPYVQIEYKFRFRDGIAPWQYRVPDRGRMGWYNDSTGTPQKGAIVNANGVQPGFDVLMDGQDRPMDIRYLIASGLDGDYQTPVVCPLTISGLAIDEDLTTDDITVLNWLNIKKADFSALGL